MNTLKPVDEILIESKIYAANLSQKHAVRVTVTAKDEKKVFLSGKINRINEPNDFYTAFKLLRNAGYYYKTIDFSEGDIELFYRDKMQFDEDIDKYYQIKILYKFKFVKTEKELKF